MSTHRSVVTIGTKSTSSMWDEFFIREKLPQERDLVEEGWMPLTEIAVRLDLSLKGCAPRMVQLVKAGEFEMCDGITKAHKRAKFFRPCKSPSK